MPVGSVTWPTCQQHLWIWEQNCIKHPACAHMAAAGKCLTAKNSYTCCDPWEACKTPSDYFPLLSSLYSKCCDKGTLPVKQGHLLCQPAVCAEGCVNVKTAT